MAYESEHSLSTGLSNNTVAQANLLNNGVTTIGSLSSSNDVDYYKIDTDGAALVTLSFLTSITLTSSVWTISLLDFSGADYLLSPIRTFTTSPLVDGANQASSTLDVKGLSTLPPVGSRFTLATDGADTTIYTVVSATPLQGDTSTITLDNAVANPAHGAALVFDPVSSSVGSSTTVQALVDAAGTYYIKVAKGDVASTQEYSVTATVTSTDEHESNDTKTDAAESNNYLLNGIAMTGNLSDSNDNDVWLFTTTTTADVTLDFAAASGNAATPEWAVSLKEWSGQTVLNNTGSPITLSAGVSASATATNAAAKTYMVTVTPTNLSTVNTGTYTLKISGAALDLNDTPVMSVGTVTSASSNTVIDTGVITSMEAGEHSARLLSTLCSATDADSGQTLSYFVTLAKPANATSTASIKVGDTLYGFSDGMASPAALWLSAAQMATATLYAGTTTGDVTLTLQAKDNSGAQDGSDYGAFMKQTLHIVADTTLPTLMSSTPADDAAHVLVGSDMTLTFSEAVQAGMGNIVISDGTDTRTIAITDSSQVTFDGSTVTINLTDDLHSGSSYHVEIASGVVEDLAGNAYAGISDPEMFDFVVVSHTVITGDNSNNSLNGSIEDDTIYGYRGNDAICGGNSNDIIYGNGDQAIYHCPISYSLSAPGEAYDYNYKYYDDTGSQLTDGILGDNNYMIEYAYEWIGWRSAEPVITFFFDHSITVDDIVIGFNRAEQAYIFLPINVRINENYFALYGNEIADAIRGFIEFHGSFGSSTISITLQDNSTGRYIFIDEILFIEKNGSNILFNSIIDNDTIDGGNGDDAVGFSGNRADYIVSYNQETNTYTITDTIPYRDGTDIIENVEQFLFADGTWNDIIAPILVSATPSDNATSVAVESNIILTFDENVQAGNGNIAISNGADTRTISVTDSLQVTFDGSMVIINPTDDLHSGSSYHVEMASGVIKDLADNAFAGISDAETLDFATTNTLGGHITFWKTGEALADVTSTLMPEGSTGTAPDVSFTDSDGHYQHNNVASGNYQLATTKAADAAITAAVTVDDALAALKMAVKLNPNDNGSDVCNAQYLAADVNHDGKVNARDALLILKMSMQQPAAPAHEWVFAPESVNNTPMNYRAVDWVDNPIPVTLEHDIQLDLIGIVSGDVI